MIDSKLKLIKYIRSMLGEPLVKVEITDFQISEIIDNVVQKFTEYAYGDLEAIVKLNLDGARTYQLPEAITNIIQLSKGSSGNITDFGTNYGKGFVPEIWSNQYFQGSITGTIIPVICQISATQSIIDKYFKDELKYNFNPYKKTLQLFEDYKGTALLHYNYEYIANETHDMIYNQEWVKQYSIAQTKLLWGSVLGKYSQTLVGGAQLNYADIKSDAQSEIEKLDEQLLTKWCDPAPVMVC